MAKQPYKRKQNKFWKISVKTISDFSVNRAESLRLYDAFGIDMSHQTSNDKKDFLRAFMIDMQLCQASDSSSRK